MNQKKKVFLKMTGDRGGRHLSQTLLSGPHRCVDDLEEKLACPWVEDKNGPIDWLGGQVTLKCLK